MIFTLDSYRTPIRIRGKNQLSLFLHYGVLEQCLNGDINLKRTSAQMEILFYQRYNCELVYLIIIGI